MTTPTDPPPLRGVHHIKIPVSDLAGALAFYTAALGARRIPEADHLLPDGTAYAYILRVQDLDTLVEIRLDPDQAEAQRGYDPVTFSVADRTELAAWLDHLAGVGARHSPVLAGLAAWLIVIESPDGLRLRLMTRESHGPELAPDTASEWIRDPLRFGHSS